ncbi:MAG: hypothetical protein ACLRQF_15075 [Thomasclavelia ramosa]
MTEGKHEIALIAAEGEHSAAGICYGASVAGARVFNATSANGLLYALEQFPVQSGTRFPMLMVLVDSFWSTFNQGDKAISCIC